MKIVYNQNPLKSRVELTEEDKEILRLKMILNATISEVFDAYYKQDNIEKIKDSLEKIIDSQDDANSTVYKSVEKVLDLYLDELENGYEHGGDCTSVACSCVKCHAEQELGVNTLEGLTHLHFVKSAFDKCKTLDKSIQHMLNSPIIANWDASDTQYETWYRQRAACLKGLIQYKLKHFCDKYEDRMYMNFLLRVVERQMK